jgi:hypothetical protein
MTFEELGKSAKKSYPNIYGHLSDYEAGQKAYEDFPGEFNVDMSLAIRGNSSMSKITEIDSFSDQRLQVELFGDSHLEDGLNELQQYYYPHRGAITAWWQKRKSKARLELQRVLNEEQLAVLEAIERKRALVINGQMELNNYNLFIANNRFVLGQLQVKEALIIQALKAGYSLEAYEDKQRQDNALARAKEAKRHETNEQIRLEGELSKIRLHEFKEKEAIALKNKLDEWNEKLRLAIISKMMTNHQKRELVQELLDNIYKQIDDIRNGKLSEETKQHMIEDRQSTIEAYRNYRDSIQLT